MKHEHQAPWDCVYAKEDTSYCKPGKRPRSDQEYFEILCLCLLQAGLSWGSIRKHWENYKEGFCGFHIRRLAEARADEVLKRPHVIKNRKKVEAIIHNAKEFQKIKKENGSFSLFLKRFKQIEDGPLIAVLTKQFKHIGTYTAKYYLHSVGYPG
jgi:DNA-3-methyladenine glycosylase I